MSDDVKISKRPVAPSGGDAGYAARLVIEGTKVELTRP